MQLSSQRNTNFRCLEASRKLPEALCEASGRRTCSTWLASKPPGVEKARTLKNAALVSTKRLLSTPRGLQKHLRSTPPGFEEAPRSSLRSIRTSNMLDMARFEASWPRKRSNFENAALVLTKRLLSTPRGLEQAPRSSLRNTRTPNMLATARFEASWPRKSSTHACFRDRFDPSKPRERSNSLATKLPDSRQCSTRLASKPPGREKARSMLASTPQTIEKDRRNGRSSSRPLGSKLLARCHLARD